MSILQDFHLQLYRPFRAKKYSTCILLTFFFESIHADCDLSINWYVIFRESTTRLHLLYCVKSTYDVDTFAFRFCTRRERKVHARLYLADIATIFAVHALARDFVRAYASRRAGCISRVRRNVRYIFQRPDH